MKLGVVGKGGVGKTTVAALLARALARRGQRVLAVDTDSNPNLGISLGLDLPETEAVPLIPRGMAVGSRGDITASELVEEYGRPTPAGVTLLSAMRVTEPAAGCTCSSHASVRSLLAAAVEDEADVTLVDMEAGLEHLSRSGGTLAHADVLIVVMEPTRKAVVTAARTRELAHDLGIPRVVGLGNKVRRPDDDEFLRRAAEDHDVTLLGVLPWMAEVVEVDREGGGLVEPVPPVVEDEIERVLDALIA